MSQPIRVTRLTGHTLNLLDRVADPDIFDGPVSADAAMRVATAPGHAVFLAVADVGVVGQICGMVQRQLCAPDALFVDNLGVAQSHRRRGVARTLWTATCAWARAEGAHAVWVATEKACAEAQHLYTALGLSEGRAITFDGDLL